MNYSNLKLFLEYNSVRFTKSPINDKYLSFLVLSENDNTLSSLTNIKFDGDPIRNYIVPTSFAPFRTYMNSDYKTNIKNSGFIPIKSNVHEINKFNNKHNYIDINRYFDTIIDRMNTNVFNNKKYIELFNNYIKSICNYIPTNFEKNLIYTINIDKEFSDKLLNRKILPLYLSLLNGEQIPLNKIFIVYYSIKNNTKEFVLLYDSTKKENISKIRSLLLKYKYNKKEEIMNDKPIDDTIYDFDEDEIKTATDFKESYSAWTDGAISLSLNEAWQAKLAKLGVKFLSRGAKAAPEAAQAAAKAGLLRRAASGAAGAATSAARATKNVVVKKATQAANTAKSVKGEIVNVAQNPKKLIQKRPDTPLDPTNKRAFDFARNPNDYIQKYYAGLGASKNESLARSAKNAAESKLAAAKLSAEQGGKAVKINSWNPFSKKVTANVNDIKKYEDEVLSAKEKAEAASKEAEKLKYGSRVGTLAAKYSAGNRPITKATSAVAGAGALGGLGLYSDLDTVKSIVTVDPRDQELADKQNELNQLYGYVGQLEQQPQQQTQGFQMPQLSNTGKVAVAGAGVAAGVGLAYAAWQRAQQKKQENYYASGCVNLQGPQLTNCIQAVNNLKLKNLQAVLNSCGSDSQCIQNTNAELDAVQLAMRENRIAD